MPIGRVNFISRGEYHPKSGSWLRPSSCILAEDVETGRDVGRSAQPADSRRFVGHLWRAHAGRVGQALPLAVDQFLPGLFGMDGIASEDSVQRAFLRGEEANYTWWMDGSMNKTFEPLLTEEWGLDIEGTVKTLHGKQEETGAGCNPTKPGRPSHV